jgi:hypothetical protein
MRWTGIAFVLLLSCSKKKPELPASEPLGKGEYALEKLKVQGGREILSETGVRYTVPEGWTGGDELPLPWGLRADFKSPSKEAWAQFEQHTSVSDPEKCLDSAINMDKRSGAQITVHDRRVEDGGVTADYTKVWKGRTTRELFRSVRRGNQAFSITFACEADRWPAHESTFRAHAAKFDRVAGSGKGP